MALLFSAILSWWMAAAGRPNARINLRFAAMMLAVFSAARALPSSALALDAALLMPSLAAAATVLALLLPRRGRVWLSCLILGAALAAGLLAALRAMPALALGYQSGAAVALSVWGLSRFGESPYASVLASLGAASLLFGAMAMMNGSLSAAMLFFAAFLPLMIRALQAAVADGRRRDSVFVSGARA
ncbi:MAG TPA: hypothetical protein VGI89_05690 [Rhizomicrobium sp.]